MALLGDSDNLMCTAEDALLADVAARHGHLNSLDFFARRRRLFRRLDDSLGTLVKRGIDFPDHPSLRHALGISTRSLTHHWRQAGPRDIPGYASHIEGVARASRYIKAGGWIGIGLGGVGSCAKVREACAVGCNITKGAGSLAAPPAT